MTDLASHPEHATRKRALLQQFSGLQKQLGDTLELGPVFGPQ